MTRGRKKIAPGGISALPGAAEATRADYAAIIRRARLLCGMTQPQLAAALGVTKNAVTNWEAGASRPDLDTVPRLCRVLGLSADSFFALPAHENSLSGEEWELVRGLRRLSPYERNSVARLVEAMIENDAQAFRDACQKNFVRLAFSPLSASAGTGDPLGDGLGRRHIFLRATAAVKQADEVIPVNGDSMLPTFHDGDLLLVQHTQSLAPGEIGIFVVAGEGFVKEYQPDGLHSHNPKYSIIRPGEDDNAHCVGRVLDVVQPDWRPSTEEKAELETLYAHRGRK